MSAVANPSPAPSTGSSTLKRRHDSSSDEDFCPKQRYFYMLAPASTDYSTDGTESIYSVQAKSTDIARDTSDTSTKCSDSDDGRMIEFEVVSFSESEHEFPFPVSSTSSPEDVIRLPLKSVGLNAVGSVPSSSHVSVEEGFDDDVKMGKLRSSGYYIFCSRCHNVNSNSHFMYCLTCYRLRKSFLPERPKSLRNKSKKRKSLNVGNDSGINSQTSSAASIDIREGKNLPLPSVDPSLAHQLCQICMVRPRDGGFCHENIIHAYSCYRCSLRTYKQRGRCPVCNRRIQHVSKIISV